MVFINVACVCWCVCVSVTWCLMGCLVENAVVYIDTRTRSLCVCVSVCVLVLPVARVCIYIRAYQHASTQHASTYLASPLAHAHRGRDVGVVWAWIRAQYKMLVRSTHPPPLTRKRINARLPYTPLLRATFKGVRC